MQKINFIKIAASGNDFVVITSLRSPVIPLKRLAKIMCDRKYGAGGDGLLLLEKSQIADIKMRIFNPDGSEAEMCGNGARSVALFTKSKRIETQAGIIESRVNGEKIKIKLTEPKALKLDLPVRVNNRTLQVNFINTGVPHTVIFVADLDKIDVINIGRQIRFHKRFAPAGTNVDFVEALSNKSIKIRTYERGVEDETRACGTGIVASAVVTIARLPEIKAISHKINVHTKSGEMLKVYFDKIGDKFRDVWLEGKARIVYKGVYYV